MSAKTKKITKHQFDFFQDCCYEYIEKFGCKQYEVEIKKAKLDGQCARVKVSQGGAWANIEINQDMTIPVGQTINEYLRVTALHECLHILLSNYRMLSECRFNVDGEDVSSEEEKIIRVLEKLL